MSEIFISIKDMDSGKVNIEAWGGDLEDPETGAERISASIFELIRNVANYAEEVSNDKREDI